MVQKEGWQKDRLYVCETCIRDAPVPIDDRTEGQKLSDALKNGLSGSNLSSDLVFRQVHCLNGCLKPCNVALRAPGKFNLRFSLLREADAVAVLNMAELYIQHPTGDVPPDLWPSQLENKLTVRTPPPPQFNAGRGK